jgi:hypothetical protein
VTTHEYDDAGRLIRSVSEPEPEWDDDDRALMRALWLVEGDECPGCHGSLEETTSPETYDTYRAVATRCHRCHAIALGQERSDGELKQALLWTAEKRV